MLRNFARGACSFIRVSPVAEPIAASPTLARNGRFAVSISWTGDGDRQRGIANDSVGLASGAASRRHASVRSARPARADPAPGVGLDRPFFDDKNRAFWMLQSIGWTGYFILRSLSGFANSMGAMFDRPHRCC